MISGIMAARGVSAERRFFSKFYPFVFFLFLLGFKKKPVIVFCLTSTTYTGQLKDRLKRRIIDVSTLLWARFSCSRAILGGLTCPPV